MELTDPKCAFYFIIFLLRCVNVLSVYFFTVFCVF